MLDDRHVHDWNFGVGFQIYVTMQGTDPVSEFIYLGVPDIDSYMPLLVPSQHSWATNYHSRFVKYGQDDYLHQRHHHAVLNHWINWDQKIYRIYN